MAGPVGRRLASWLLGFVAVALAIVSLRAISQQPLTTYGGSRPALLWLEVAAAAGLILGAATLVSRGRVLAGVALATAGLAWLGSEVSGIAGESTMQRGLAATLGWFVVPLAAVAVGVLHAPTPARRPSTAAIASAVVLASATVLVVSQVDPFFDRDCWQICTHSPTAVAGLADWQPGFRGASMVLVCAWGVAALILVARPGLLTGALGSARSAGRTGTFVHPSSRMAAGVMLAGLIAVRPLQLTTDERPDSASFVAVMVTAQLAAIAMSLEIGAGWARSLRLRRSLRSLAVSLESMRTPDAFAGALARALADPDLEIAFCVPDNGSWVDPAGQPLDPSPRTGRAVTKVVRDNQPIARIIHSDRLGADEVEAALGPALTLAVENARLQASSLAELADLRASRERIVERSDRERVRLERNLHDGVQQRVVGLVLLLGMVRAQAALLDPRSAAVAADGLRIAERVLAELRSIARGIYPAVLTDAGLAIAISDLAEGQADVDVAVDAPAGIRFPTSVEAAAYLVVDSAVRDAADRRARTVDIALDVVRDRLLVDVRDDGLPIEQPAALQFADRVEVLNGVLSVAGSPAGARGSLLHLEVPCAW